MGKCLIERKKKEMGEWGKSPKASGFRPGVVGMTWRFSFSFSLLPPTHTPFHFLHFCEWGIVFQETLKDFGVRQHNYNCQQLRTTHQELGIVLGALHILLLIPATTLYWLLSPFQMWKMKLSHDKGLCWVPNPPVLQVPELMTTSIFISNFFLLDGWS